MAGGQVDAEVLRDLQFAFARRGRGSLVGPVDERDRTAAVVCERAGFDEWFGGTRGLRNISRQCGRGDQRANGGGKIVAHREIGAANFRGVREARPKARDGGVAFAEALARDGGLLIGEAREDFGGARFERFATNGGLHLGV